MGRAWSNWLERAVYLSNGLPKMLPSPHLSLCCRTWLMLTHRPSGEARFLKTAPCTYGHQTCLHCHMQALRAAQQPGTSSCQALAWHQAPPVNHEVGSQAKAATGNPVSPSVRAVHTYTVKRDVLVPPETQAWTELSYLQRPWRGNWL